MPSQKNIRLVADYTSKIEQSKAVFLTNYRGLSVNDLVALRAKVRQAGGELVVTKNNLLKISLEATNHPLGEADDYTGPTATLFAYDDEITPLKALVEYAKDKALPALKLGYFEHKLLSQAEVAAFSQLPGLDQLRAQLVGTIAAPLTGLARDLVYHQTALVRALKAIKGKTN